MTTYPEDAKFYLRREYANRHRRNPAYSWRSFARDLKMSPSMLSEFLKGRYGLSRAKALNVAHHIRLEPNHADHFADLLEAAFHRSTLVRQNARRRAEGRLNMNNLGPLQGWLPLALLEVLALEGGPASAAGWAEPPADLDRALAQLRALDAIGPGLVPTSSLSFATGTSEQLRRLHGEFLELARRRLAAASPEDDNLSVCVRVRAADLADLKRELGESVLQCLQRFEDLAGADADRVLAVAVQAFPLYRKS